MSERLALFEWTLQPGTGKAIEVRAGQILRIAQTEGGQCADFNCFSLHDYKEYMHCGRTRTVHGFHPSKGTFLWSAPPRERAMMYILEDTYGRNDVLSVPNVCGSDVMRTSNFALKPVQLTVLQATEAEIASVPKVPILKSQRTPKDFINPRI